MADPPMRTNSGDIPRAAESLLAFWLEAGVDVCLEAEPVDRLAPARPPATALPATAPPTRTAARAPPRRGGDPAAGSGDPGVEADRVAEARAAAGAASDLALLAAAIAAFEGCGLKHQGARQAVCWRGRADARLLLIGEAPGAEEDARGEPFVGRAGRLLDVMLAHAGLSDRCLIANTVYWRPPGNRTPTLAEQRVCAPFLERTIALVRPQLLLLLGAAAARSVLGAGEGILALRGKWSAWSADDSQPAIPVMPTLHPAFLLRQPLGKKKAWQDLMTLSARLEETKA